MTAAVVLDELEPGPWLDELVTIWNRDGELTTSAVEKAARKPTSALHPYFEWDEKAAATQYRLVQAGRLIRRAKIVLTVEDKSFSVRAFTHTSANAYQPTSRVMATSAMRTEVFSRMRADIEVLVRRYEKYERIAEVKGAVQQLRAWLKDHS